MSTFVKIMTLLKTSKSPLDPSQFLRSLKQVLIKSGRSEFNLFQQQDACEILSCILDELCSESVLALHLININIKNTVTCNSCLLSNIQEDPCKILQLPVSTSVQQSMNSFLQPEELQNDNLYFCNVCSSLQPGLLEHEVSKLGDILIIQLKRFLSFGTSVSKDTKAVKCEKQIKIPITVDTDIIFHKTFSLFAVVNHSGTLQRGHYTALVNNLPTSTWFHCNDAAVIPSKQDVSEELAYILFYKAL